MKLCIIFSSASANCVVTAIKVVRLWLLWVCSVVADLFVNKNGVKCNYH